MGKRKTLIEYVLVFFCPKQIKIHNSKTFIQRWITFNIETGTTALGAEFNP